MLDDLIKMISNTDRQIRLRRVVLGLCYIAVQLENHSVGISANIMSNRASDCAVFSKAGELKGSCIGEILALGDGKDLLSRAVCLATINALTNIDGCGLSGDIFKELSYHKGDRVIMVGYIEPVARMFKNSGCIVRVYDNRFDTGPFHNNQQPLDSACSGAAIIIITGTSIINNTIKEILKFSKDAREVIVMGPSTPMAPAAFLSTPTSYLAGSRVIDAEKTMEIVMEGGGTPLLYRFGGIEKIFYKVRQS